MRDNKKAYKKYGHQGVLRTGNKQRKRRIEGEMTPLPLHT